MLRATIWQYIFDGNGSLIETRPGDQPGSGAKRYTYNTAGQLIQVEMHDGTSYQVQAEMIYNGQGQRLALTAHQAGQSLTTSYLLDGAPASTGGTLLAATTNGATTDYLPGIGEHKQEWSYFLADGMNSVRQVSDDDGQITLTRSFSPWGELLEQEGEGDFTWGYLGGVLDAATGLIYVGNGQYYDPTTGRFLTRGVNPGAANPYIPWRGDPLGMIVAPLALLTVMRGKKKAGKIDQILVVLIVALALGATLTGCDIGTPTSTVTEIVNEPSRTVTVTHYPRPSQTETGTVIPTATTSPTTNPTTPLPCPTLTPTPFMDIETIPYPGLPAFDGYGAWEKTLKKYKEIRDWFIANDKEEGLDISFDQDGNGPRFKDDVLLTLIITGEIQMYKGKTIYKNCLKALHNQYQSIDLCGGNCNSVKKQLIWLSTKQMMRQSTAHFFIDNYKNNLGDGRGVRQGSYGGSDNWEWGNYTKGSPFGKFISGEEKEPIYDYADMDNNPDFFNPILDTDYAGFVVFTHAQDDACGNCLGW